MSIQTLNSSQTKEMLRQAYRRRNNRNCPPKNETEGAEFTTLTTAVNGKGEVTRPPVNCPVCSQAHKVEDYPDLKNWTLISMLSTLKRRVYASDIWVLVNTVPNNVLKEEDVEWTTALTIATLWFMELCQCSCMQLLLVVAVPESYCR